jgi:hypothetical protein
LPLLALACKKVGLSKFNDSKKTGLLYANLIHGSAPPIPPPPPSNRDKDMDNNSRGTGGRGRGRGNPFSDLKVT